MAFKIKRSKEKKPKYVYGVKEWKVKPQSDIIFKVDDFEPSESEEYDKYYREQVESMMKKINERNAKLDTDDLYRTYYLGGGDTYWCGTFTDYPFSDMGYSGDEGIVMELLPATKIEVKFDDEGNIIAESSIDLKKWKGYRKLEKYKDSGTWSNISTSINGYLSAVNKSTKKQFEGMVEGIR